MKYTIVLTVLSLIPYFSLFGQLINKDSLLVALQNTKSEYDHIHCLLDLSNYYTSINNDSCEYYLDQAMILLSDDADPMQQYMAQQLEAIVFVNKSEFDSAYLVLSSTLANLKLTGTDPEKDRDLMMIKAELHDNFSGVYWRKGDYESAITEGLLAIGIFDSLSQVYPEDHLIVRSIASSNLSVANFYASYHRSDLAMKYFKKALVNFEKCNEPVGTLYSLANIGANYLDNEMYDSAIYYLKDAKVIVDSLKVDRLKPMIMINLGDAYLGAQEHEKTGLIMYETMSLAQVKSDKGWLTRTYNFMSKYQRTMGQYDSAVYYARKGLSQGFEEIDTKIELYENLSLAYEMSNEYRLALKYWKRFDSINDSIYNAQTNHSILELEAQYQNEKKEREIAIQEAAIGLLEKDNRINQLVNYLLSIGLLALFVVGYFVYKHYSRKKALLETSLQLEKVQKENAQLRSSELERELDLKSQQLTSYTVNFVQKNELLKELKETIEGISIPGLETLPKDLNRVKRTIDSHVNIDQDWEEFRLFFEGVHKGFFSGLKEKYPDLTSNDLKVCALTRLNLNLKESSSILGISPESVKMARYRLKKRMELGKEATLMNHLMNFG